MWPDYDSNHVRNTHIEFKKIIIKVLNWHFTLTKVHFSIVVMQMQQGLFGYCISEDIKVLRNKTNIHR